MLRLIGENTMFIGVLGLAILACLINGTIWPIPFIIIVIEVSTGFAGSMVGWISNMGDGE